MTWLLPLLLVSGWDQQAYDRVRHGWKNPVLDAAMPAVASLTETVPLAAADATAWLVGDPNLRTTALQAGVSWAGANAVLLTVRAVVRRPRPEESGTPWWKSSFPSGHTTGYFSMASVYAWRYPRLAGPLAGGGLLVALSRVYLGRHYPSDVLVGAMLGIGTGALALALWPEDRGVELAGEGALASAGAALGTAVLTAALPEGRIRPAMAGTMTGDRVRAGVEVGF